MNYFDKNDICRENAKKAILMITGHKESDQINIDAFLKTTRLIDWGLLIQLLDLNKLFAMFWSMTNGFNQYGMDIPSMVLISKMAKGIQNRYSIYNNYLTRLLETDLVLAEQMVIIKGYALNASLYQKAGFENARVFSDVDLVINPEASKKLCEKLISMGFGIKEKPNGANATLIDESNVWTPQISFDIHYGNPSKLNLGKKAYVWNLFQNHKIALHIDGFETYTCCPELHFLLTANHLYEHSQRFVNILLLDDIRWNRLVDLELLIPECNAGLIVELAEQLDWIKPLYYINQLITDLHEEKIVFTNLKGQLPNIQLKKSDIDTNEIIQTIIMQDGNVRYWPISIKERILEPRRIHYVQDMLDHKDDRINDWFNLESGGMYHEKLTNTVKRDSE